MPLFFLPTLLLLYQECFAGEIRSDREDFKKEESLDVEFLQQDFDEIKVEIEETKVTASFNDVCNTTTAGSESSGLLNRCMYYVNFGADFIHSISIHLDLPSTFTRN